MGLTACTRLGPYEIISALGAGGMGEVYRARDTKLGRDVALKVIPDTFALDPDRTAQRPAAHPTVEVIVRKER
jgi:eukaryotic-like serine/threonine-protein kinase